MLNQTWRPGWASTAEDLLQVTQDQLEALQQTWREASDAGHILTSLEMAQLHLRYQHAQVLAQLTTARTLVEIKNTLSTLITEDPTP